MISSFFFFVGNDFLPHLPSLDIHGGLDYYLLNVYKQVLPGLGDYITGSGEVDLSQVDVILAEVGAIEDYYVFTMK
jgi:5'-3' exoribonuclease 2